MHLTEIKIIVFDLDDTLYSEKTYVKSGFLAVSDYLQHAGISHKDLFSSMWHRFRAGTRGTIFNDVLQAEGISADDQLVKQLVHVYRSHPPRITLYPDAKFVLHHFHGRLRLGLLTDGYLEAQKRKVRALQIEHYFDMIVFTDIFGRQCWKPSPAGYASIMQNLGLAGSQCLYVGDNPQKDFCGARSLGWKSVHITRPDGIHNLPESIDPALRADIAIKNLAQLTDMIA